VVSYGATLRAKEIGIRIALGAPRLSLLRVAVRQVLAPGAVGLVVGLLAAFAAARALSAEPFYLQSVDPSAFLAALALFAAAGTIAATWPALATLRANPLEALRRE